MTPDITWVDDFVRSISEHIYVRAKDSLLILLPNQAYKLNPTGLYLLKQTLDGRAIADVMANRMGDEAAVQDVHDFFCDVRALMMGCLGEGGDRRAVETVPFERPHNSLPVLSEIALTYRCNLSCRFCYAGCNCTKMPESHEMTTDQVKRVLEIIRYDAEVPSLSWTGGEPTLRHDLVELTRHAVGIGLRVNLITNGSNITKELAGSLKDAGLRSAQVSLEGPDAQVHEALTQVPGSFERTIKGVAVLKEAGIHVHTNTTVNRVNGPYLAGIVALAKKLGLDRLSMNMVIPCGSAPDAEVTITYTEMADLIGGVRSAAREHGVEFMWYSPTPYCIFNPIAARLGGKSCAACDGLLSVAPNGDVLPCSSVPKSVGNLLKTKFDKVWNSRRALYWRGKRFAHGICKKCPEFNLCTGACPIYWDAMGYEELRVMGGVVCRS